MKQTTTIRRFLHRSQGLFLCLLASLCAGSFLSATAHAQLYPPGSVYAAGTLYPNVDVQNGSVAGGYFGNGSGKVYDLAVTNATAGGGPFLTVFTGNGDGTFNSTGYSFAGSGMVDGLATIYSGPLTGAGKVDLVATDDARNLFLIPGNGDGTFGTPVALNQVAYTLQTFPNPNGTLNLLTSSVTFSPTLNENLTTVTILTNNGSGSFSAQTLLNNSTYQLAEVDYLNLAGTPSLLLLGNDGTAELSTAVNGTFGTPAAYSLNLPQGVVISGVLPFVLNGNTSFAALSNGVLYVFIGNANGTFQTPYSEDWSAYSPVQLYTADLNGDQIPDLVLLGGGAYSNSEYVLPLYGNSLGKFSASFLTGPGVYGSGLGIGDVNGDGHPDLVLTEPNAGLTVLLNQGDGSFPHPKTFAASPQIINNTSVPDDPWAVATADLNGDGIPDLVVANGTNYFTETNTDTVSVFLGQGNGVFSYAGDTAVSAQPIGMTLATVDGKIDAFVINAFNGNIDLLQGNGDGTFTSQGTFTGGTYLPLGNAFAIVSGAIGPSGGEGVVVADSAGGITVFTPLNGVWTATASYTVGTHPITSMSLIDVNGDGFPELLVSLAATPAYSPTGENTVNPGSVLVFPGTGSGTFGTPITIQSSQPEWSPGYVTAGPLTGGAILDLVVVNGICYACTLAGPLDTTQTLAIFSGSSLAGLQEKDLGSPLDGVSSPEGSQYGDSQTAAVADANGDGINDVIVSYDGLVGVLPGQGGGIFGTPSVQVASTDTAGFVTGSFFNPGGHDVVVASSQGVTPLKSLLGKTGTQPGAPYAEFSPVSLNYGTVSPGSPISLTLTLTNAGTATLSVNSFAIEQASGAPAPEFKSTGVLCGTVANPANLVIPPGANCDLTIQFNPPASGPYSAQIAFTDNAAQANVTSTPVGNGALFSQIIPLSGTGTSVPVQLAPASLPSASLNVPYTQKFSATGGSGSYTFKESGALPAGMTFSGATLSGTPTKAGPFPITVTATDSSGATSSITYPFSVGCVLAINPPSGILPTATIGLIYDQGFTFTGPDLPFTWSFSGNLPQGLQFNGGSTTLSTVAGTTLAPTGDFSFALTVTDTANCSVSNNYLIAVSNPLAITPNLPAGSAGTAYSGGFTASGGTSPYTYLISGLPAGLTYSTQSGAITGTPTQSGSYPLTVVATDAKGIEGLLQATLTVQSVTITLGVTETVYVSDGTPTETPGISQPVTETILVTDTVNVNVLNTPVITWAAPAPIVYGTPLGTAQLDAAASVPGTFTYSPVSGTLLRAGTQTLTALFTPTDGNDYAPVSTQVPITVNKAAPAINWPTPSPISVGTPLSSKQLDATANIPGTFAYDPGAGTVLTAGLQKLSTTFTPTDFVDYIPATAAVNLLVQTNGKAPSEPTFSPLPGRYSAGISVTLSDATADANIYYTTNGETPTTSSTLYTAPINLTASTTMKAIAVAHGAVTKVLSGYFIISGASKCNLIDFADGFDTSGLRLNGGATIVKKSLQLTDDKNFEARSAFDDRVVSLANFSTDFTFQLINPQADGFAFVLQTDSPTALGEEGGGLGYAGIPNSTAVKFDLYNNGGEGIDSTGVFYDGAFPSTPAINLAPSGINLHSGHVFAVHISYNGTNAYMTITDTVTNAVFTLTRDIPFGLNVSSGYVGFTGGTGGLSATQDILSWTYSTSSVCE